MERGEEITSSSPWPQTSVKPLRHDFCLHDSYNTPTVWWSAWDDGKGRNQVFERSPLLSQPTLSTYSR